MIPLAEAQAELIAAVPRLPAVTVPLAAAAGCVSAADVVATQLVPPFVNSHLDGYAVRAADVEGANHERPVRLTVLGSVPAGRVAPTPVQPGTTWKVMTGAPMPEGADTVVMVENSSATRSEPRAGAGDTVELYAGPPVGAGTREAGSDVRPGEVVLRAGTVLQAPHLGVLASVGVRAVSVFPRPRVGVLVTGDELVTEDRPLQVGEIYESNRVMVLQLLRDSGCEPVDLGVASDAPEALAKRLLDAAAECEALVTTGGVSMGDADPVKVALDSLGRLRALQISMRPAKPFAYALLDGPAGPVPLFGLPGNPVSSLVSFELLARPALRAMAGHTALHRAAVTAVADAPLVAVGTDGRTNYVRVTAAFAQDGRLHVRTVGRQDSHQLAATADADALAEVPPNTTINPGGDVLVRLLRWDCLAELDDGSKRY